MPSANFYHLVQSPDRHLFDQLKALAASNNGPLRIEYEGNIPSIGIRSWPTYFFEKVTCALTINSLKNIEKETIEAIQLHAPPILEAFPDSDGVPSHMLLHKLCTRTSEKSIKPKLGKKGFSQNSNTRPDYRNYTFTKAKMKTFAGMMIIPNGLSITTASTEKIMADCHIVAPKLALPATTVDDSDTAVESIFDYMIPKKLLTTLIYESVTPNEADFFDYYYEILKSNGDSIHTCVAIEVFSDSYFGTTMTNRNGAIRAAELFMADRKINGNSVSISLSVNGNWHEVTKEQFRSSPDLPIINQNATTTFIALYMADQINSESLQGRKIENYAVIEDFSDSDIDDSDDEITSVGKGDEGPAHRLSRPGEIDSDNETDNEGNASDDEVVFITQQFVESLR